MDVKSQRFGSCCIPIIHGRNERAFGHGTSILGIVSAVDNTLDCVGIAPNCTTRVASMFISPGIQDVENSLLYVISQMVFGDILLIPVVGHAYRPLETHPLVFNVVRLGSALGIIIIESSGFGYTGVGNNLNDFRDDSFSRGYVFNRTSPDFRDSGL